MAPKELTTLAVLARDYAIYYKAIFARTLFGTHATVAVWRTTVLMGVHYWALLFGVVCLCVEYIVTMWANMGNEWPWISPSTLCYLATVGSSLWVQKLQSLGHISWTNGSTVATVPSTTVTLDFSPADWLLLTEQSMMMTIILSRWLLPKGEMSHTELSALLLLYLGLSADILDFSTIFNEPKVAADETFCYVLLVVWTGSLFQFFLVLTATKKAEEEEKISLRSIVCSSEVWQILVQVGLQDLPFLIIRVVVMLNYQVFTYTIIFFVCKNTLVICLEVNHMIGLCLEQRARLKRRQARLIALKDKLRTAKNTLALTRKSPFNLAKGNSQSAGKTDGGTPKQNMLSLAGVAFAAKEADGEPGTSKVNPQDGPEKSRDKKLLRFGSKLSGGSDDGYATAAEGSSSRPNSGEPSPAANGEHKTEQSGHETGHSGHATIKSSLGPKKIPTGPNQRDKSPLSQFSSRKKSTPHKKDTSGAHQANPRQGSPPLGHFLSSANTGIINTTDSSALNLAPEAKGGEGTGHSKPFVASVFGNTKTDSVF